MFLLTSPTSGGLNGACCWEMGRDKGDNYRCDLFTAVSLGPFNGAGNLGPPSCRRFSNWGDQRVCLCVTPLQPVGAARMLARKPSCHSSLALWPTGGRLCLCVCLWDVGSRVVWTNEAQGVLLAKVSL